MSSVSRELALEATVAFREREYEQAIVALTELDKLLDGGNELVKRNLVVAQWYATQQKYAASFEQWLDLHEAIPDGKRSTDSTFIAQFNRALYCFYANRPQKALTILQAVCFNERKAESRLEVSLVLLALDLFLGERNIRCAIEYFGKLAPDSVDKHATPDKPGYFDIVYRLYEARVQLASGRKWDAVGNLLQLNIPEESHEDTRRPLYVAHWHLRSQLALACYQTDTPYDLVNWTVDTADTRAIDQNARGCIYLQQGKWGLAAYAFNEATALLDREEKQRTRGQFYRMQHGCCSIREALFINRCLVQLVTGQLIATINQVEEFLVRQLDKQQYTSSIYWLLLGEAIIYLYVDELTSVPIEITLTNIRCTS
ncbi:hypothetical protein BDF22DRAFT_703549 [Syncephalis plumigaleata]|nr:hypothetical protein BDF22DRAFT_703549 [Syncephalis plumigaleata]